MGTKTISITEDVYLNLTKVKRPEESFSDEIRRLLEKKERISECAGLWSRWMNKEDIENIEINVTKRREASRKAKSEKEPIGL